MNQQKPKLSLFLAYSTVRERMSAFLDQTLKEFPIPSFMVESVLNGMISDVRSKVICELSGEHNTFVEQLTDYYEHRIKEEENNGE